MRNRPLCSGCLCVFLILSLCIFTGGAKFVKELRPTVFEREVKDGAGVRLTGCVYNIDEKEKYQIIYLKNNSIFYQNKSFKEPRIILYNEQKLNIEIGNQIETSGTVSFYERERNPGNFNQKFYYQKQGIHAMVWSEAIKITEDTVAGLSNGLYRFRIRWKEILRETLGEKDGAILTAMLLGDKAEMDEEIQSIYQANGVAHILAISGLHLSIIGVGLYKMCRRLSGSYLLGGIAGTGFLILYILMIGASVSVIRAFIMFLFRVGAEITGRCYDSPTALSVAAVSTIVWNPLYLYDGGFWLSYSAVLGIILVFPMFEKFIVQCLWASISINLATMPVLLYYFYEIPLYSVILNMIVVPLMTIVLLSGLIGSMLCIITTDIGGSMLWICKVIFNIYDMLCKIFLKLPFARIIAGQPEIWQIAIYYICLLIVVMVWKYREKCKKMKPWGIIISCTMLLLTTCLLLFPVGEHGLLSVTMLDVSQGDGIFIRGPKGNAYFIDGGSSDEKQVGKYRIEPFLKSQGIGKLDYIFISHGDSDHISGIMEMIERMECEVAIETIILPNREVWNNNLIELARIALENEIKVVTISVGQQLVEGEMVLSCLAPQDELAEKISNEESNAGSMVLAIKYGEFDMLFTGDVEKEGEELLTEELTEKYGDVKWDVLKAAHHGSKNSSSEKFLDEVRPVYALISAGRENSYGHPHTETIKRLEDVGSKILSTQDCGAITVKTDGEKMRVERYLK